MKAAHRGLAVDAERALRDAGAALGLWPGDGGSAWSVRRAAAGRALDRLDEAARDVAAAREALVREVEAETDRMLTADGTVCAVGWGVCPGAREHVVLFWRSNLVPASRLWPGVGRSPGGLPL